MAKAKFDRTEVVHAATQLFWQRGYQAASMQDVFQVTGLQPGSLYNAFGSKAGLFEETVRHYSKISFERVSEELTSAPSIDVGICSVLLRMIRESTESEFCSCFLVKSQLELKSSGDEALASVVAEQLKKLETIFSEALQTGQSEEAVNAKTTSLLLNMFGLRVYGYLGYGYDHLLQGVRESLSWLPWDEALTLPVNAYPAQSIQ
ncbi:TetR/AcrR family transcriptional regulator [Sessilibacter sp. MAH2]